MIDWASFVTAHRLSRLEFGFNDMRPHNYEDLVYNAIGLAGEVGEFISLLKRRAEARLEDSTVLLEKEMREELTDSFIYVIQLGAVLELDFGQQFKDQALALKKISDTSYNGLVVDSLSLSSAAGEYMNLLKKVIRSQRYGKLKRGEKLESLKAQLREQLVSVLAHVFLVGRILEVDFEKQYNANSQKFFDNFSSNPKPLTLSENIDEHASVEF